MTDRIQQAYHTSRNAYDDVLTQGNVFSRLYVNLFWQGVDDNAIARQVLSWVPEDFSGRLLDVPAGTAVFTARTWAGLTGAAITCLDYSADMLAQAKSRLAGCENITFVQGDVAHLPFDDASFDLVVSMNGFHAFPDKTRAYDETSRVLAPGGLFVGCFYLAGKSARTDWLVNHVLAKKGWFTPPFQTEDDVELSLVKRYRHVEINPVGPMVLFRCEK